MDFESDDTDFGIERVMAASPWTSSYNGLLFYKTRTPEAELQRMYASARAAARKKRALP